MLIWLRLWLWQEKQDKVGPKNALYFENLPNWRFEPPLKIYSSRNNLTPLSFCSVCLQYSVCIYRYRGEDDDRMSIASRKMTAYAKTDCIGASKGLFFGLITLVLGVISLILFFVLIDNENQQVRLSFICN